MILSCDNRIYTGITTDIQRRWKQHTGSSRGARFFRGRLPQRLLYLENNHDRASASKREAAIKKMTRTQKEHLLATDINQVYVLSDHLPVRDNNFNE